MKYRQCAATAALLLSLASPALISRPVIAQECATTGGVTEQIRRETPAAEVRMIGGQSAARLRAGISSLLGQDVPKGGSYLLAHAPSALTTYVVRFVNGCATHHGRFPDRLVQIWLDGSPA